MYEVLALRIREHEGRPRTVFLDTTPPYYVVHSNEWSYPTTITVTTTNTYELVESLKSAGFRVNLDPLP